MSRPRPSDGRRSGSPQQQDLGGQLPLRRHALAYRRRDHGVAASHGRHANVSSSDVAWPTITRMVCVPAARGGSPGIRSRGRKSPTARVWLHRPLESICGTGPAHRTNRRGYTFPSSRIDSCRKTFNPSVAWSEALAKVTRNSGHDMTGENNGRIVTLPAGGGFRAHNVVSGEDGPGLLGERGTGERQPMRIRPQTNVALMCDTTLLRVPLRTAEGHTVDHDPKRAARVPLLSPDGACPLENMGAPEARPSWFAWFARDIAASTSTASHVIAIPEHAQLRTCRHCGLAAKSPRATARCRTWMPTTPCSSRSSATRVPPTAVARRTVLSAIMASVPKSVPTFWRFLLRGARHR